MGANTKIEWAHHTFNPWIGCSKVSLGCVNCYAEEMMDKRYGKAQWGPGGTRVRTSEANWKKPLQWDKAAAAAGERHRVFCASLADVFEDRDELIGWQADLFKLIQQTPNLDWLLLTKRPENVSRTVSRIIAHLAMDTGKNLSTGRMAYRWYVDHQAPENVWIGTSVENQGQADKRIRALLRIPAKVRFLSMEPLLGPVDLGGWLLRYQSKVSGLRYSNPKAAGDYDTLPGIDWVIVGGESGRYARPMEPQWVLDIQEKCKAARVSFFFKQGSQNNWKSYKDFDSVPVGLRFREVPHVTDQ